jgi:uncharacterized membrane protein
MKSSMRTLSIVGLILAVIGSIVFLLATPGDLLRKLDVIAAAVCHRRASHSFFIAGRQLPLCQRCTGTFSGALTGILIHWLLWRRRRSIRFPRWPVFVLLVLVAALWGLDGLNSTTADAYPHELMGSLVSRASGVGLLGYRPQPWLRLVSGALMGMAMSVVLVPAFNQTLWSDGIDERTLRSWRELGLLTLIELGVAGVILILVRWSSWIALILVSFYSVSGVLAMFILLGAMTVALIFEDKARVTSWRAAWGPMAWGVVFALGVIATMVMIRLRFTGTLDGVPGLN